MSRLYELDPFDPAAPFPDPQHALRDPDGLLAVGGDLTPTRLLNAYCRGIFPWFSDDQPILWWSPDPRAVLLPEQIKVSRSLAKTLRRQTFRITTDTAFAEVLRGCAAPRPQQEGTWLVDEMQAAYQRLHELGVAHSVECWHEGRLAGGLYGLQIGRAFFGESMFSRVTDASKAALTHLCRNQPFGPIDLVDCQVASNHLTRMGAISIPRRDFLSLLRQACGNACDQLGE